MNQNNRWGCAPAYLNPEPSPLNPEPSSLAPDTQREVQAAVSTKGPNRTAEFFRSVANLGIQAAEALEHAHQMGVVHRDIKPSNLMVEFALPSPAGRGAVSLLPSPACGRGAASLLPSPACGRGAGGEGLRLWITDFGLAMTQKDPALTLTGDILGTLRYMSPEQALGKRSEMNHRTDIYSLGVTLYELLTLQPAFAGDKRETLVRRLLEDDPPRPRTVNRAIPKDLETIVLKATAKEPQQRYGSAQEMADDLRRYLDDKPIRAKRPSLVERTAKWSRRHKPVVWSTAVLFLTAAIATVVVAWNRYQKVLQIEQHLTAAGALLQSGDYVAADRELAEAQGRLGAVLYPSGGLAADLAGLTAQVSGKKEADERFQRFKEYRQSVHANMYNATPNTMDRVQEDCRAALALYRVFDSFRLDVQRGFQLLSPQRQAMLKEAVAELLFAWAEMEAAREHEPRDLPEAHRRTIAVLERIERYYRPIPAVYLWIAQSRRALGEADAALQAEKRAAAQPPTSGLDYFILGEFHYLCDDQPEKALADYSLALRRQPDHYLSLLASGLTLWALDRHNEAVAMLTGAIAVNPRTTVAYLWRGNSCWKLREYALAQADFDAAVAIDPQDYHAFWGLAQLRGGRGDAAAAMAMYDKAVALAPTPPTPVLLARSQVHAGLGNRDKALADFSRVIDWLRPRLELAQSIRHYRGAMNEEPHATYIQACQERSKIYKQLGQLDKAEDDLKEALRPAPKSVQSYQARATVEAAQGEFDKAIADCSEAIRLNPLSSSAYISRGIVCIEKGDFDRAIADCSQAIRLNPLNPVYYRVRAAWYLEKDDFNRAIADCTEAIRLNPKDDVAYNNRGVAHCEKRDFDKALADLDEAIRLNPKNAVAYNNRGVAHREKGDFDKALADLDEAIRLNPKHAVAYCNRALLYIEKGATEDGLRDLSKAVEPGENDAHVWRLVALGRLAAGRLDEYRGTCSAMLGQFAQTENSKHGSETAWACALTPDAVGDWPKVVALAEMAQKRDAKSPRYQLNLGAVLYRAGRFEEAIQRLAEADRLVPEPMERARRSPAETWFFLAMAHHRAGHAEEAKKWLDKASAWTDKALREHETFTGPRLSFYRRALLKRFRAEAAELLGIGKK